MKLLTKIWLAGLVATAMSISAFGACTATLDLGGYKITNATMSDLGTSSEVATKAYVDNLSAGGIRGTQLSAKIDLATAGLAFKTCADYTTGGTDWRVPTFDELVGLIHTVNTSGETDAWYITSTPYNKSTAGAGDTTTDTGRYLTFDSPGHSSHPGIWNNASYFYTGGSVRCVR